MFSVDEGATNSVEVKACFCSLELVGFGQVADPAHGSVSSVPTPSTVALFGGGLIATYVYNRPSQEFLESARGILGNLDFYSGLAKSMIFGAIIATIACDRGLNTSDGAEGVGRSTNQTVVAAVIAVLIANLIMTCFVQQILKPVTG